MPLALRLADFSDVQTVFTDVDGTLTTQGRLRSTTLRSLEKLAEAQIRVVLVTGRSAGWGECWARTWPVDGVIVENGGLYYFKQPNGMLGKHYLEPETVRKKNRALLKREVDRGLRQVKRARLSMDSAYTEVDLAIDYNESMRLGDKAADALEGLLRSRSLNVVRSSVHVNCWVGAFDKAVAVKHFIRHRLKTRIGLDERRFVYVGDSLNDAPMFAAFPLSIGVANVSTVLDKIETAPRYITRFDEGRGFEEMAEQLLRSQVRSEAS